MYLKIKNEIDKLAKCGDGECNILINDLLSRKESLLNKCINSLSNYEKVFSDLDKRNRDNFDYYEKEILLNVSPDVYKDGDIDVLRCFFKKDEKNLLLEEGRKIESEISEMFNQILSDKIKISDLNFDSLLGNFSKVFFKNISKISLSKDDEFSLEDKYYNHKVPLSE
jgi:hypothetical protein